MDYRSPLAGLQRQVEELTEELAALQAAPGEAERKVADDSELAKLRRAAKRIEARAGKHRKKTRLRGLTPRERVCFTRMQGSGVLRLVLGGFMALYLLVIAFQGAPFDSTETYVTVAAATGLLGGGLLVFFAHLDARNRRAGRVAADDVSPGRSD